MRNWKEGGGKFGREKVREREKGREIGSGEGREWEVRITKIFRKNMKEMEERRKI